MDTVTIAVLVGAFFGAAFGLGWWLSRRRPTGVDAGAPYDHLESLAPKALTPSFSVDDWDGYSGMQAALCVELSDGARYPLIPAGTVPPVQTQHTFSTSAATQTELTLALYTGLSDEPDPSALVERLSIGPIPVTGEAIREVEVALSVDVDGTVTVAATSDTGEAVACRVAEAGPARLQVGWPT